jgi:hypothetical protein
VAHSINTNSTQHHTTAQCNKVENTEHEAESTKYKVQSTKNAVKIKTKQELQLEKKVYRLREQHK